LAVALDGCRIDQRAHQGLRVQRIADDDLRIGARQARLELRRALAMDEHASRARAALSGRADRAEYDRRHGEIQIRALIDDDRFVAAELEQRLAEPRCDLLRDLTAD